MALCVSHPGGAMGCGESVRLLVGTVGKVFFLLCAHP